MNPVGEADVEDGLERRLRPRHVQLIAIGGTIGVGLFLGSAAGIHAAGPGLLLNYMAAGVAIFFIMRALGELLVLRPVSGALAVYARDYVSPFAGFATGWSYWFNWVAVGMAELTAIGIYVHFWHPDAPQWLTALVVLTLLYAANLLTVRVFGEVEFWFALIKLTVIALAIGAGVLILSFGISSLAPTATLRNLWNQGGVLPHGLLGLFLTLQMVTFAYSGVEVIAMTAAETEDPRRSVPRAVNGVVARILVCYVGSILVILCLIPWNRLSDSTSPFVFLFTRLGIPGAASIMNLVVITAAASSCNSGLYSTGRMLHFLAHRGQAPGVFAKLNDKHVPAAGITVSAAVMLLGVALNAIVPEKAFVWVTSIALVGTLWTWSIIMLAHLGYRRRLTAAGGDVGRFAMPGAPFANWLVIGFLALVVVMLALNPETRVALYVAPIWFALLAFTYRRCTLKSGQSSERNNP